MLASSMCITHHPENLCFALGPIHVITASHIESFFVFMHPCVLHTIFALPLLLYAQTVELEGLGEGGVSLPVRTRQEAKLQLNHPHQARFHVISPSIKVEIIDKPISFASSLASESFMVKINQHRLYQHVIQEKRVIFCCDKWVITKVKVMRQLLCNKMITQSWQVLARQFNVSAGTIYQYSNILPIYLLTIDISMS